MRRGRAGGAQDSQEEGAQGAGAGRGEQWLWGWARQRWLLTWVVEAGEESRGKGRCVGPSWLGEIGSK